MLSIFLNVIFIFNYSTFIFVSNIFYTFRALNELLQIRFYNLLKSVSTRDTPFDTKHAHL